MMFDYLKTEGEFILKNRVNIDHEELNRIYEDVFNKYAVRQSFNIETTKQNFLVDNDKFIVKNLEIVPLKKKIYSEKSGKMQEGFNVSYDLYEKPELCRIIEGIINPETFECNYNFLNSKIVSLRKEKIEKLRFEMDQEIRKIEVMLDDPEFDYYLSLQKIRANEKKIIKLCEFDREYSVFASRILETIKVNEIDRIFRDEFEKMVCFFNYDNKQDELLTPQNDIVMPDKVLKKISSC